MPLWALIFLIITAAIAGSIIGTFSVLAWALCSIHNYKGSRQRKRTADNCTQ
jgi:hypothetical protein